MELNQTVSAVITGGASGLGAGTARALAAKGCRVGILDVNQGYGEAVAKEIGGTFAKCDVTDEASVDAALAAVTGGTRARAGSGQLCRDRNRQAGGAARS